MAENEKPVVNDKKNTNPPPKTAPKPVVQNEVKKTKPVKEEINIEETIASFDETLNSLFGNEIFNTEIGVDINDPDFDQNAYKSKKAQPQKAPEPTKAPQVEKEIITTKVDAKQPTEAVEVKAPTPKKEEPKPTTNPEHITMLKQNAKDIKDLTDLNHNLNNNLNQYKSDNQQLIKENKHQAETIEKAKTYIERIKQEYMKVASINQEFANKFEQLKKDLQEKAKDAIIESKKTYEEKIKELDEKNKEESKKKEILFEQASKQMKQEYDKLADQFRLSQTKLKETSELYKETIDDSHRFKERIDKEKQDALKYANIKLVDELLLPLEQLETTCSIEYQNPEIQKFILGFKLINRQLFEILEAYGLKEIQIPENTVFDPQVHEAHETVTVEDKDNDVIVEVIKKGYFFKDRLLRASLVKVNKK